MAAVVERRLFTRQEYHAMVRAGILTEDERVELLDGEIVRKIPSGPSHAGCIKRLNRILTKLAGDAVIVAVQNPLGLGDYSEPEPDVMLLRPQSDFYSESHPSSADALLVIEVADSSLAADVEVKVPFYAAHDVVEVWVVDLQQRQGLAYRDPVGGRYADEKIYRIGDSITLSALPGQHLRVSDLGL